MKKIKFYLLFLLISLFSFQLIYAVDEATEFANARFLVNEILEANDLPFGISHTKIDGFTSTSLTGYDADGLGGSSALVVPGKYYEQKVNVLEVPSIQGVRITTWANLNNHKWTLTTVRKLIADFESKNPEWEVVGAINGDFFDIRGERNLPYSTSGGLVTNGEFYKTNTSRNQLVGFTNDGSTNSLIGNKVIQKTQYMKLAVYDKDDKIFFESDIEKINAAPGNNETAIYFANYDEGHNLIPKSFTVPPGSSCFVVENAELALPNFADDFYGRGVISSLIPQELKRGQFALVTNNNVVRALLRTGIKIRCQFEYSGDYANATDITGCGATIMADGEPNLRAGMSNRAPRTVIGKKADGTIVMMVIDGRQATKGMYGADHTELAVVMKNFDCVEAYNLDGGGSSTMIIKKDGNFVVLNSPSDGWERSDANCILIATRTPQLDYQFVSSSALEVTLTASVVDAAGHDIHELYVEFGGRLKKLGSDLTIFSGLKSNTEYYYAFKYRDRYGDLITLPYDGRIKTLKSPPDNLRFEIFEDDLSFNISFYYDDPDQASSLNRAYLTVNNQEVLAVDGRVTLHKQVVGLRFDSLSIRYTVDLNDGAKTITQDIDDYILTSSLELNTLFAILEKVEGIIADIYQ